jgi:histone H3
MSKVEKTNGIKKRTIPKVKKTINPEKSTGGIRKPHRFRPGTVSAREVRKQQQSVKEIIPYAPFQRLVRQVAFQLPYHNSICDSLKTTFTGIRFRREAIEALQSASEDYLIKIFKDGKRAQDHAKRKTIMVSDMQLFADQSKDYSVKEGQSARIKNTNFDEIQYKKEKKRIVKKPEEPIINENQSQNEDIDRGEEAMSQFPDFGKFI